jgi:hypothetical protein
MDVENRDWPTQHRGRVLIHATATVRQEGYAAFQQACRGHFLAPGNELQLRSLVMLF